MGASIRMYGHGQDGKHERTGNSLANASFTMCGELIPPLADNARICQDVVAESTW